MRINYSHIILVLLALILLSACKTEATVIPTNTPEKTSTNTPEPTSTFTATPTMTSTPEYYTEEEKKADGKIWAAEQYTWPAYSMDGKNGECVALPQDVYGEVNVSTFHLSQPGGNLAFDHIVYIRSSPNIWINEPGEAERKYSNEALTTRTLEISADQVIVTTVIVSTSNEAVSCVNRYTLKEGDLSLTPTLQFTTQPTSQIMITTLDFYTEEEIVAQGKAWYADFYQSPKLNKVGYATCDYYENEKRDFSQSLFYFLPNQGEDLLIGEGYYSRISPNVWEQKLNENPYCFQVSRIIEISKESIIETWTILSPNYETTTCINEFHTQE